MKKLFYKQGWFWVIVAVVVVGIGMILSQTNSPKDSYTVGETAVTENYKLTIDSANIVKSNNFIIKPENGKDFLEVVMTIENTSTEEMVVSSLLDFDTYVDDFSINEDLFGVAIASEKGLDGNIAPGKKLHGALMYQVPSDWKKLEIQVDLDLDSQKEVTVLIPNRAK